MQRADTSGTASKSLFRTQLNCEFDCACRWQPGCQLRKRRLRYDAVFMQLAERLQLTCIQVHGMWGEKHKWDRKMTAKQLCRRLVLSSREGPEMADRLKGHRLRLQ